jgi:pectinesterase
VTLLSNSNHSVVFRCEIKVYQDTLLAENHLQFHRDCEISGTISVVFGGCRDSSRTV